MRKLWIAILACGVVAGSPWALTHARFAGERAARSNKFTTGLLDLSSSPSSSFLSFTGMAPGDVVTAPVTVSNAGTEPLRYAMSIEVGGDGKLAAGLTLTVKSGVGACSTAGFDADGTTVYSGSLGAGAIGDAAGGAQAGDRTLNASASETLCFRVGLPSAAMNPLQGLSTTLTFTFNAEHASNG